MSESAKQLESLIARGYQHGFVTDIESDTVPPGLGRERRTAHFAQKERARVPDRVAAESTASLAEYE